VQLFNSQRSFYPQIDSYTLIDTNRPNVKVCRVWIGPNLQTQQALEAGCYFEAGQNPYSHWTDPGLAVVGDNLACNCPAVYPRYDSAYGVCTAAPSNQVISLSGPTETRPAGTGGVSKTDFVAKVTSDGVPKPGVALSFSLGVT
jgi:hypothetical protein